MYVLHHILGVVFKMICLYTYFYFIIYLYIFTNCYIFILFILFIKVLLHISYIFIVTCWLHDFIIIAYTCHSFLLVHNYYIIVLNECYIFITLLLKMYYHTLITLCNKFISIGQTQYFFFYMKSHTATSSLPITTCTVLIYLMLQYTMQLVYRKQDSIKNLKHFSGNISQFSWIWIVNFIIIT